MRINLWGNLRRTAFVHCNLFVQIDQALTIQPNINLSLIVPRIMIYVVWKTNL